MVQVTTILSISGILLSVALSSSLAALGLGTMASPVHGYERSESSTETHPNLVLLVNINVSQPSPVPYNVKINFTSQVRGGIPPYTYRWYLGDGTNGTSANDSIEGEQAGSYQAVLAVTDSVGDRGIAHADYTVEYAYGGLNAYANASARMPSAGSTIYFTTSITGGYGTNYSYSWSFGDGTSGGGATTSHAFAEGGLYPVEVYVSDIFMEHALYYIDIFVPPSIPVVGIKAVGVSGYPPLTTALAGSFTGGFQDVRCSSYAFPPTCRVSGSSYNWSFGDGTYAAGPANLTHEFVQPGSYTVQLKLTDTYGDSASHTVTVQVLVPVLESVFVSPPSRSISMGGSQPFTAYPSCMGGACPAGTVYEWTLNNTLGSLKADNGSSATFTAGLHSGTVRLTVMATLNGKTAWANATVTIQPKSSVPPSHPTSSSSLLGLPGYDGYLVVMGVAIAIVATLTMVLLTMKRRRHPSKNSSPEAPRSPSVDGMPSPPPSPPK